MLCYVMSFHPISRYILLLGLHCIKVFDGTPVPSPHIHTHSLESHLQHSTVQYNTALFCTVQYIQDTCLPDIFLTSAADIADACIAGAVLVAGSRSVGGAVGGALDCLVHEEEQYELQYSMGVSYKYLG